MCCICILLVSVLIFRTHSLGICSAAEQCVHLRSVYDLIAFTWANDFIAIREWCSGVQCTAYMHYNVLASLAVAFACHKFYECNAFCISHLFFSSVYISLHSPDEEMVDVVRLLYFCTAGNFTICWKMIMHSRKCRANGYGSRVQILHALYTNDVIKH